MPGSGASCGRSVLSLVLAWLLLLSGAVVLAGPASAAGGVSLTAKPSPVLVGAHATLTAVVSPHGAGRPVEFARRSGSGWVAMGTDRTDKHGVAVLTTSFPTAGTIGLRAVAEAHGGEPKRTATTKVSVVAPHFVTVEGPASVETGDTFEVTTTVKASQALPHAVVTLTAPAAGSQRASDWPTVDTTTHQATVRLGSLAKGASRVVTLAWQAPDTTGSLPFVVRLDATGVREKEKRSVAVVAAPPGSFRFDTSLRTTRESRTAPASDHFFEAPECDSGAAAPVASFAETLAAIDAYTDAGTSTSQWQDLDLAHHPENADDVATIALTADRPNAALAASIAGFRSGDDDLNSLNTAAAAANLVGRPEWAVALEMRAASLSQTGSVGVKSAAVRLDNLAHARALMGDWSAAKTLVGQAVTLDPVSTILDQELAVVDYCGGDTAGSVDAYDKSVRSDSRPDEVSVVNDFAPQNNYTRVNATRQFAQSTGVAEDGLVLPYLPTSPLSFHALHGYYTAEYDRLWQRDNDLASQNSDLEQQFAAEDLEPVTRRRIEDMLRLGYDDADTAIEAARDHLSEIAGRDWAPNGCPGHAAAGVTGMGGFCGYNAGYSCNDWQITWQEYHDRMNAHLTAYRSYLDTAWPIWTSVLAQLEDPVARQLFINHLEGAFDFEVAIAILSNLKSSSDRMTGDPYPGTDNCFSGPADETADEDTEAPTSTPAACGASSPLSPLNMVFEGLASEGSAAGVSVKFGCSQAELDIDVPALPFLGGFAKVTVPYNGSGVTMFAGSKASIPNTASFESAFYISFDGTGHVSDIGVDAGPEVEFGTGITVTPTATSDHVHMSAMSLFTDPLGSPDG